MRAFVAIGILALTGSLAGCGGSDEPEKKEEREAITPENNVFGTLVGAPKKAEDRTNAAVDQHRENMNQRLEQDEGGSRQEPAED